MPSSSLLLSVGTLVSALSSPALATLYKQQDVYQGDSFLQGFDFLVTDKDPTNGFVSYIGEQQATTEKLLRKEGGSQYIGVDYTTKLTVGGKGRKSVRIETKTNYNQGLYVVDIKHMPGGICGTWPAFWSLGSGEWPKNGEIDIIEGVNTNTANKFVLHTDTQCSVDGLDQKDPQNLYNCALDSPSSTAGCDVNSAQPNTYGSSFNDNGGGVYAMEWTSDFIKMWFFPRNAIPSTLSDATPDTSKFGKPNANFKGNCDIAKKFINQRFIFDTTFCGDWAGNVYAQSGCPMYTGLSGYDSCMKYVAENPGAFEEAYWLINSFKTYTKSTGTISSSSSTVSSTASSTVGSSTASSSYAASSSVASSSVVSSSHSASASVSASSDVSASTQYPTGSTTPHESDISKTSTQYPVETPYETEKYPASSTPYESDVSSSAHYPVETPYETEKYPASSTPCESDVSSSAHYAAETPYETEKYPASSTPCESDVSSSAHYPVETPYETEKYPTSSTPQYPVETPYETEKYPASSTPCESEASSSATGYPGHQPSSEYPVEKPSSAPLYPVGASSAPLYPTAAPSVKPYEHSTTVTTTYTTTYVDVCSTGYTTITTTHTATYCPDATPTPVSGYPAPPPPGFTVTEKYCEHGCGSYPTTVTVTIPCTACGIKPTPASYEVYTPQPSAPGHAYEHKSFPPGPYETVVTLSTKHVVPTPSSYPGCNGKDCPHETPSYQGSYPGCSGKDCSPEASSYPVNHNNVPHSTGYIHYSTGALPTKTSGYPSIPEFTGAASNVKSGVVAVVGAAFAVAML